ncbi:hypothetical protein IKE84_01720 [Candidatus Saccharibacteria bacterium]|nr:hypothetical protein [Candidatus Saccharibacteria bacterium]
MSKKLKIIGAFALAFAGLIGIATTLTTSGLSLGNSTTSSDSTSSATATTKLVDETVYIFTKTDGSTRKIISSDWTKNLGIDEYSTIVTNDKKVPIDLAVSYTLDGNTVSASELIGKSGKVTIRYTYTNKETASGYYVPYAVVSGMMLDNNHFKNVEVKNAKLINDGARTIIAGIMMPGMQENLGINASTFEIPNYFEVTADVIDFELGLTMSIATNEVFNNMDFSNLNSIDQLSSELNKMTTAMDQLIAGSSDLANGINTLYEKAGVLPDGIAALSNGASQLKNGSLNLASGAKRIDAGVDLLQAGVEELYTGIKGTTDTYNSQLQNGALQVLQSSLASANANTTLRGAMETYCGIPTTTASPMTVENYPEISATCLSGIAEASPEVAAVKQSLDGVSELYTGIVRYTNGIAEMNENEIKNHLLAKITEPENGLKAGTSTLSAGAAALATGATDLSDGIETLNGSTPTLIEGISKLRDGSTALSNGLKQFNEEAIQKLVNIYNNDFRSLIDRIRAISNVAKNNSKNIKYIYRTDEIKK